MTVGHDDEFRQLFAQEADQRLTRLGQELLRLEEAGSDEGLVASIFRDAHTLKGAAAVVGLDDIGRVAHAMEDILEELRGGLRPTTPPLVDALLAAVDGLTAMLPAAVGGEAQADTAAALVRTLRDAAATAGDAAAVAVDVAPVAAAAPTEHRSAVGETVMVSVDRLDELVRLVGESAAAHLRIGRLLTEQLSVDPATLTEYRDLSRVLNELQERTMRARLVPVSTVTDSLHRAARDLARTLGKEVRWEVRGGDTELDRGVLQQLSDPLLHLVRNAVDHGIETPAQRASAGKPSVADLRLHAMQLGSDVIITLSDDGRGIDIEAVRDRAVERGEDTGLSDDDVLDLIFRSGMSTAKSISDVSGRGVGLDVVRTSVEAVRGRIEVRTDPGAGTEFRIVVPITLAVLRCLLVGVGSRRYAVPMHSVVVAQSTATAVDAHVEGRPVVWVGSEAVAVSSLAATLGVPEPAEHPSHIVVVAGLTRRHAFRVDALIGQRDVVVKGLGGLVPRLEVLAGASVEPDGAILLVLDAPGLIERARGVRPSQAPIAASAVQETAATSRGAILVVDDALTVRELERSILERAGYQVKVAADGVEALARLAEGSFDLVLADVEMPRMDGFALTEAIRAHPTLANLPILILTSRASDEDRRRGLDAGADGYIVKSAFDETALLAAIEQFVSGAGA